MKEISILFTRHERGMEGERGEKNINFPLKDSNLRPSNLRSEVLTHSYRFLVNEPRSTVDT